MNTPFNNELLSISWAPVRDSSVEYYQTIERTVTLINRSEMPLQIEEVVVYCPADAPDVPFLATIKCAFRMDPHEDKDLVISITPNALYKQYTNLRDVRVKFRLHDGTRISETKERTARGLMSIIVDEPTENLGRIFISFKQEEDRSLARTVAKLAKRAGFTPFLKAEHPRPGEDQWDDIEKKLRVSLAVLVIWTDFTGLGDGVEKEVKFCHAAGIHDILLLGDDVDPPPMYTHESTRSKEYVRFDRQNPSLKFVEVIELLRDVHLAEAG